MKKNRFSILIVIALMVFSMSVTAFAQEVNVIADTDELKNWVDAYVADNGLNGPGKELSVGFIYTRTGDEFYYNADTFMYSASMYKVPVSMLLSEKEAAGEINQQTQIVGGLTVEYLERTAIVDSNNDSGHYIADYMGTGVSKYDTYRGKDADMIKKYAPRIDDSYYTDDFYNQSYYTARFITQVLYTLYSGGEAQYPYVIYYMKQAQPQGYYNVSLGGKFEVAQKYGAYVEPNGDNNNHCTAIIYTPNPVIVTVMTKNIAQYEKVIADIGAYLADYALKLDQIPDPTPTPAPTPEAARTPEPTIVPIETSAPTADPDNMGSEVKFPFYVLLIIPLLVVAIITVKHISKKDREQENPQAEKHVQEWKKPAAEEPEREQEKEKGKYVPKH